MALNRERTGTMDMQGRPNTRDHKKLNLFQRLASVATGGSNHNNNNHHHHRRSNHYRSHNHGSTAMATSAARSLTLSHPRHHPNHHHVHHQPHRNRHMTYSAPKATANVMDWLQSGECPSEILPNILAYAGPQVACTLSKTNHFWNDLLNEESTWRVMCEELYKWKQGDEIPDSFRDFYKYNPCVPVDYPTIHSALEVVNVARNDAVAQPKAVRVLLRPGRYILREAITIEENPTAAGGGGNNNNANNTPIAVELATMEYFPTAFHPSKLEAARNALCSPLEPEPTKKRKKSLRNIFQCRTVDVAEEEPAAVDDSLVAMDIDAGAGNGGGIPADMLLENDPLGGGGNVGGFASTTAAVASSPSSLQANAKVNRASLYLRTRRHNEPLLRIRQGSCTLRNIELKHICHGTDIWNGNAAVQLQPPMGPDDQPLLAHPAPTVTLDRVEITSASGRGIVNIDGGLINATNCYVHDCAATGVYVGGPGSRANIVSSDVVRNGNGNSQHRRGIARGHSGIYLEQGHASIVDCNVSQNSLTGISAVSPENAVLNLEESDLVSNGTYQLEMPAVGTVAHRNSNTSNNNLATAGLARSRSGLVIEN